MSSAGRRWRNYLHSFKVARMHYSEDDLRAAQAAGVIGAADFARLVAFLAKRQPAEPAGDAVPIPKFDAAHLL
jgi:DICT domain-containing protein